MRSLTDFPKSRLKRVTREVVGVCGHIRAAQGRRSVLGERLARGVTRRLGAPITDVRKCLRAVLSGPRVGRIAGTRFLRHYFTRDRQLASLLRSVSALGHLSSNSSVVSFRTMSVARVITSVAHRATLTQRREGVAFSGQVPRRVIIGKGQDLVCDVFHGLASGTVTCTKRKYGVALRTGRRKGG